MSEAVERVFAILCEYSRGPIPNYVLVIIASTHVMAVAFKMRVKLILFIRLMEISICHIFLGNQLLETNIFFKLFKQTQELTFTSSLRLFYNLQTCLSQYRHILNHTIAIYVIRPKNRNCWKLNIFKFI